MFGFMKKKAVVHAGCIEGAVTTGEHKKKVVAKVELFEDDTCGVCGSLMDIARMYISCKEALKSMGIPGEIVERADEIFGAEVTK